MADHLDLPRGIVEDEMVDLDERLKYVMAELYPKLGGQRQVSRTGRFLGFKTTMGIDHYPHPSYGMHNLF